MLVRLLVRLLALMVVLLGAALLSQVVGEGDLDTETMPESQVEWALPFRACHSPQAQYHNCKHIKRHGSSMHHCALWWYAYVPSGEAETETEAEAEGEGEKRKRACVFAKSIVGDF